MRTSSVLFATLTIIHSVHSSNIILDLNSGSWTLRNKNGSIVVPGTVPGGVYSDLYNAGVIGDILYGYNDVLTRWVAYDTWTYTGIFNVSSELLRTQVAHLTLHGVDTVATVELNGRLVGSTNNMFVRYVFDVKQYLQKGENILNVRFVSPVEAARILSEKYFTAPICLPKEYFGECHANQLRKMQSSFAWDLGPAFPSVGLWKQACIEFFNNFIIRSAMTHITKGDAYWHLNLIVNLESKQTVKNIKGCLRVIIRVDNDQEVTEGRYFKVRTKEDGTADVDIYLKISEDLVRLWWPYGYGDQPLYDLNIYIINEEGIEIAHKELQIGFRTLEIVEEDASLVLGNTTAAQGLTFYFRVNGYPLFMKGTNWVPTHILPELSADKQRVDNLLRAVLDVHISLMRVWGGGVYESEYFYKRCDQLGVLLWQDFLFACAMYPVYDEFLNNVKLEVRQTIKRLQHHPSIALWSGNNENEAALRGNWYKTQSEFKRYVIEYVKLYVDTIKPIAISLDPGRRYLVSSPTNGIESERTGHIALNPYDSCYGISNFYNYSADNWNINIHPVTRFTSEYGVQSLPSISTMRTATNDDKDFNIDSEFFNRRQHHPNGYKIIEVQLNKRLKLDRNDVNYFEKFVFYSQISQAMSIKTQTEFYRQSQEDWYTMGAMFWNLNDVWQAPTWSSIEYGGKWKMLHYFAKTFFAPVLVSPRLLLTGDVLVYLLNDRFVPITSGNITVDVYNWSSLDLIKSQSFPAVAKPLSSNRQNIPVGLLEEYNREEVFLRFSLKADGVPSSPYNYVFPEPVKFAKGLREPNIQINVSNYNGYRSERGFEYDVDIRVDTVVLFLWLETVKNEGHFEENGFVVTEPYMRVKYSSQINIQPRELEESIRYQYYMN